MNFGICRTIANRAIIVDVALLLIAKGRLFLGVLFSEMLTVSLFTEALDLR